MFGTLKGNRAGEADRQISEITVAGAANADAADFKNTVHVGNGVGNLGAYSGGSGIEQGVNCAASETPTDGDDDSSDKERGDGIGKAKPIHMIDTACEDKREAQDNDAGGPDIRGKMQRVGLEGLAFIFGSNAAESAGAPHVNRHGNQHYGESPYGRLDFDATEE